MDPVRESARQRGEAPCAAAGLVVALVLSAIPSARRDQSSWRTIRRQPRSPNTRRTRHGSLDPIRSPERFLVEGSVPYFDADDPNDDRVPFDAG